MKNTLENKKKALEYLYGELKDAELDAFEERLFIDEDFSLFVDDVENDLVDEYVRGELEFEQKREFEKKYLTTDSRHERVAIARTLQEELFEDEKVAVVSTEEKTGILASLAGFLKAPNLALAGGLGALLLLVLLGGIWLATQPSKNDFAEGGNKNKEENINQKNVIVQQNTPPTPDETPEEQSETNVNESQETNNNSVNETAKPTPEVKKPNVNKPKVKPTPKPVQKKPKVNKKPKTVVRKPTTFVASLFPPLRSSQNPVLKIPASIKTVRLQLFDNFEPKYEKFVIELNSETGTTILSQEIKALKKRPQKSIRLNIPKSKLKAGTYEIAVKGVTKDENVEEINYYNFIVQREQNKREE